MRRNLVAVIGVIVCVVVLVVANSQLPAIGAGGLLHPSRRAVTGGAPPACRNETFEGDGVALHGWRCATSVQRRGTLAYLHGIADNRTSAAGTVERFVARGFDVIAYDSRAHGESDGDACTYGFFEKHDLHRVLDTAAAGPIVLVGTSLGAAVALQEAAQDPRVTAIVAAETFSDLRTVATERAPFFFTSGIIDRAFRRAEQEAHFDADAVSPVRAAASIAVPVLLIHGDRDTDTLPAHSRRVFESLRGPKQLLLVPGAHHNESLRDEGVWRQIDQFVDEALR